MPGIATPQASPGSLSPLDQAAASLTQGLERALAIPGIDAGACARLREKLAAQDFNLVVAGEFKRGKSTLINALLGESLLPTGVVPLTSVVTLVQHGDVPEARVTLDHGETRTIPIEQLADYVTERGNPGNAKGVAQVTVCARAAWLRRGIRLVDTPGIGSVHAHNTESALRFLPQADAVLFVVSADQPLSRAELDFLGEIRRHAGRTFCLLNKIDILDEAERAEAVAFAARVVREAAGSDVPVFPVSARMALRGRAAAAAPPADSGFPAFEAALQHFLMADSAEVLFASVRRHLLRLLAEARLAAELELRGLVLTTQEIADKLAAFAAARHDALQARAEVDALLEAAARGLVRDRLEPDLEAFRVALTSRLDASLGEWARQLRGGGSRALRTGLEQRLAGEVRREFDAWRAHEDATLGAAVDECCSRHWRRIEDVADTLLRRSAALFAVPYAAIATEPFARARSGFYYRFWQEPPGLMLLTNALVDALPGWLGQPLIVRQARERSAQLVDMQAGRLRHDLAERIGASLRDCRTQLHERIATTLGGIEAAIDKGRALRAAGEAAAAARTRDLEAALAAIDALVSSIGGPPSPAGEHHAD